MTKPDNGLRDEIKRRLTLPEAFAREGIHLARKGKSWVTRCPWHEDKTPSLHVDAERFKCFGCGASGDVFELFARTRSEAFVQTRDRLADELGIKDTPETNPAKKPTIITYTYQSADGAPLFFVDRIDTIDTRGKSKKSIKPRLPDGTLRKSPVQVPYRLPGLFIEIARGNAVCVVEGEKCSEILAQNGMFATTHAGGAGQSESVWTAEFAEHFRGARVVVIPDNDEPGRKHAAHVLKVLTGVAKELKLLELPLKERGEDVADWFEKYGGTTDKLKALIDQAPAIDQVDWLTELKRTRTGEVKSWSLNASRILTNDPALRDAFEFDERTLSIRFRRKMPWHKEEPTGACIEADIVRLGQYIEGKYEVAFGQDVLAAALSTEARERTVNALRDYLKNLKWDGVPRVDEWFIKRLGAEDAPDTRAITKCWLIQAVARVLNPGCQADACLVLEGSQGIGKSTFLRKLAGEEYFNDSIHEIDSKDTSLLLGRAWIVELAELEAMRKAEHTALKRFLTQRIDAFRPPYGRAPIAVPRQCVFAATTNDDTYLRDPTGNRRFWPIHCHRIDLAGVEAERDQVLAEAVARFRAGESYFLEDEEVIRAVRERQAEREDIDPWEAKLIPWLELRDEVTTSDALERCEKPVAQQNKSDEMRIAGILKRLGFERRKKRIEGKPRNVFVRRAKQGVPTVGEHVPTLSGNGVGTAEWRSDAAKHPPVPTVPAFPPSSENPPALPHAQPVADHLSVSVPSFSHLGGNGGNSRNKPHSNELDCVPTYKTDVGTVGTPVGTPPEQPRLFLVEKDGPGRKWRL